MVSIVICSRKCSISKELNQNLDETIGCDYELIVIDNSDNKYSIFQAYNKGLRKSRYAIVCFIHEDILFHTIGWGDSLIQIFLKSNFRLLGVAGSRVKSDVPSGWWEQPKDSLVVNIIQHRLDGSREHINKGFNGKQDLENVSVLDGVFLAFKKDSTLWFNEKLSGFHNYDLSFCIDTLNAGYQIGVINNILIEHFSNGRIDNSWVNSSHRFHLEYRDSLPVSINNYRLTLGQKVQQLKRFMFHCKNSGNIKLVLYYWLKLFRRKPFSGENLKYIGYFMRFTGHKISKKWN
tara:strand:+ start:159 stop:1031 length:873 start_codon:yes stop_codon:yes gene_type:complete